MTKNEKLIIASNVLYILASGMSAVFMNVFLYTYTESLIVMAIYTCLRIAMYPLCFTVAGKLARKVSYGTTLTFGLVFLMAQLMMVLSCHEMIASHTYLVYVAGILYGIGEGFYYLSVNTLNQLVSSPKTRHIFLGVSGVLGNVANVVAPLLSTFIIDLSGEDMLGYLQIFKVVLLVFAVIAILAMQIKEKGNSMDFSVIKSVQFQNDPQWKYVLMTYFLYGFRDSLVLALAGILVYNATSGSGSLYGKLLAFFAVLSILTNIFVTKTMVRRNRMKFYTVGAILLSSSTIILVLFPNIYGALYYGIVNAIAGVLYSTPFSIITMNATNDYANNENLVGRVIAKEVYVSLSRCLGMLFIVLCHFVFSEQMYLYVSVITLSLFPVILVIYANRYHHQREKMKD